MEHDELIKQLKAQADQIKPEHQFASILETQLRAHRRQPTPMLPLRYVAAGLLILLSLGLLPPVRTFAQEIIDSLFPRENSDQRTIQFTMQPTWTHVPANYSATPPPSDPLRGLLPSIFILQPHFSRFAPDGNWTSITYSAPGRSVALQRGAAENHEWQPVGESAEVIELTIKGYPAGFVEGMWIVTQQDEADHSTGETVTLYTQWDSDTSLRRLRWQVGDIYYELLSAGGSEGHPTYLSMEDMIAIAETVTPANPER